MLIPDLCPLSFRSYVWEDSRGKKCKCTAPQYVDYVMSHSQTNVRDEAVFPTKYGERPSQKVSPFFKCHATHVNRAVAWISSQLKYLSGSHDPVRLFLAWAILNPCPCRLVISHSSLSRLSCPITGFLHTDGHVFVRVSALIFFSLSA